MQNERGQRRRNRIGYLLAAPFETAIVIAACLSSAYSLIHPDPLTEAAIGQTARGLLPVWEVLYAAGGIVTFVGLWWQSVRIEIAGLSLLVSALLLQAFAIGDFSGAKGIVTGMTYAALSGACVARSYALIRARRRATE